MVHKSDEFTDFKRSFENCQCIFAKRSMEKVEGKCKSGGSFIINWQLLSCVTVANLGSKRLKQKDFLVII